MPKPNAIYLDYNATAPIRPSVIAAMTDALAQAGNPSSVHGFGRIARQSVEEAREKIAAFIDSAAPQLIFTSGGTEANNSAIAYSGRKRVLVSAIEHDSVRLVRKDAELIPVDENGLVRLNALEQMLKTNPEPALVSVMLANNETGVIQDIAAISALAKKYDALVHTDAVQALGKMKIDCRALGADMLTLSAHKAGGPQGVGVLVFSDAVPLAAMIKGGGQERSRRAGTENVAAIAGFGALIDALSATMPAEIERMRIMQSALEAKITALHPQIELIAANVARLPNTTSLVWTGYKSDMQLMRLDMSGVAVSAGSACSSGKVKPSHVLEAMGLPSDQAACALRVSTGWNSRESDIEAFCAAYAMLDQATQRGGEVRMKQTA